MYNKYVHFLFHGQISLAVMVVNVTSSYSTKDPHEEVQHCIRHTVNVSFLDPHEEAQWRAAPCTAVYTIHCKFFYLDPPEEAQRRVHC